MFIRINFRCKSCLLSGNLDSDQKKQKKKSKEMLEAFEWENWNFITSVARTIVDDSLLQKYKRFLITEAIASRLERLNLFSVNYEHAYRR